MPLLSILVSTVLAGQLVPPHEIIQILEASKVKYAIRNDANAFFDLRKLDVDHPEADPMWRVVRRSGSNTVEQISFASCAEKPLEAATKAMESNEDEKALQAYRTAWLCDTSNAKIPTWIGNVHFMTGRNDSALFWLRKAVAGNPVDYQARFFLSDAWRAAGDTARALDEFIEAFYLNPNGPNLRRFGEAMLERMGMRFDDDLYRFAFSATGTPGKQATISLGDTKLLAAAATLAAWRFDDAFARARSEPGWESDMYLNVVANQAFLWSKDSATKAHPTSQQRKIMRLMDEQLMGSAVSWEYAASVSPANIYVASPQAKANILRYIRGYLIDTIR